MTEKAKLKVIQGGKGKLPPDAITQEELDARLFVELPTIYSATLKLSKCADHFNIELKDLHDSLDRNPALKALLNASTEESKQEAVDQYEAELNRQFAEYGLPDEPDADLIGYVCHLVRSGLNNDDLGRVLSVPGALLKAYRSKHRELSENIVNAHKAYKRELNPGPYVPDQAGKDLKQIVEWASKGYTANEIAPLLNITPLQFAQALERDPLLRKCYQRGEAILRRTAIDKLVEIMDDEPKFAFGAVKFYLQARAGWSDKPTKVDPKAGAWTPGEQSLVTGRFVGPQGNEKDFDALLKAQRSKNAQVS